MFIPWWAIGILALFFLAALVRRAPACACEDIDGRLDEIVSEVSDLKSDIRAISIHLGIEEDDDESADAL